MDNWPSLNVTLMKVEEITPYDKNSRTHSAEQVDQIAQSIVEWGFTMPILIDEEKTIIAGHGRLMAAKKLGIKEAPVMTAKGWTEAQKKAYVIADNKLALNSEWNPAMLASEIEDIAKLDFNIDKIGFDSDEISKIFSEVDGIELDTEPKVDNELEEITVKFSPEVKIDVINAVTTAVLDIESAEVWTGE